MINREIDNQKLYKIAYSIPIPGGNLNIIHSANAWWMDQSKIYQLIAAFKIDATIPEACLAANITLRQYKYFTSIHPQFHEVREVYKLIPGLIAKRNIVDAIMAGNLKLSMWYLQKRRPEEFGSPSRRNKTKREQRIEQLQQKDYSNEPGVYPEDEALRLEFKERLRKNIQARAKLKSSKTSSPEKP